MAGKKKELSEKIRKNFYIRRDLAEFIDGEPELLDNMVPASLIIELIFEDLRRKPQEERINLYKKVMFRTA